MIQERNIPMCILFMIITSGIYGLYWFIKVTDETNKLLRDMKSASGGKVVFLTIITCGIYGFYWAYEMGEKVDVLKGVQGGSSNLLFIVFYAVGLVIVNLCLIQDALNNTASGTIY